MISPRDSRIWADTSRLDDGTPWITIDREFGGDHAIGSDFLLHPFLERREETVLRSVSRPQPLAEVVWLFTAAAVSHSREQVELQETADSLTAHSPL